MFIWELGAGGGRLKKVKQNKYIWQSENDHSTDPYLPVSPELVAFHAVTVIERDGAAV